MGTDNLDYTSASGEHPEAGLTCQCLCVWGGVVCRASMASGSGIEGEGWDAES